MASLLVMTSARRSSSCSVGRMPALCRIISQVRRSYQQLKPENLAHFKVDSAMVLTPFSSPGVLPVDNATMVHWGFLRAFNSVAETVISIMEEQYASYPNYRLICAGAFPCSVTFE